MALMRRVERPAQQSDAPYSTHARAYLPCQMVTLLRVSRETFAGERGCSQSVATTLPVIPDSRVSGVIRDPMVQPQEPRRNGSRLKAGMTGGVVAASLRNG